MILDSSLINVLSKEPIEVLVAFMLGVREKDIHFEDISAHFRGNLSNLETFVSLCKRLYSDHDNLAALSELPNLVPPFVQNALLREVYKQSHSNGGGIRPVIAALVGLQGSSSHDFDNIASFLPAFMTEFPQFKTANQLISKDSPAFQQLDFIQLLFDNNPYRGKNILKGSYGSLANYLDTHFHLLKEDFMSLLRLQEGFKSLGNSWSVKRMTSIDDLIYTLSLKYITDLEGVKVGTLLRVNGSYARAFRTERNELSFKLFTPTKLEEPLSIQEFTVFFEPYYQVLRALYQIKSLGRYEKYLIGTQSTRESHAELLGKILDFSSAYGSVGQRATPHDNIESFVEHLFKKDEKQSSEGPFLKLSEAEQRMEQENCAVSSSQAKALVSAVSYEITLIHGPPGTGKSFVGRKILHLFLDNKTALLGKRRAPILLLSYTNQALDNLLEGMLSVTSKVLRIGHNSSSERLFKLHEVHASMKAKGLFPPDISKLPRDSVIHPYFLENSYISSFADIIGMTTTSLAKNFESIQLLAPAVVLVEEASKILESHLLPALGKFTRHLILIGDDKQLRPKVANHKVSLKNGLEVSLFERLIMNSTEDCIQLNEQRRCSPRLLKLMSSLFYPELRSHHSKKSEEGVVPGADLNLQVLSHDLSEDEGGAFSKSHAFEAEFCLTLAEYLVKCGNPVEDITILATYRGQVDCLKELMREYKRTILLKDLQIETVDNFQGRENEIVILSLVRSERGTIGFLSVSRRITVSLTRAKKGLFVIGNLGHLSKKSRIWNKIKTYFEEEKFISSSFKLHCPTHRKLTSLSPSSPDDLKSASCSGVCGVKYAGCSHLCDRVCSFSHSLHGEDCWQVCESQCNYDHPCSSERCHGSFTPCPPCKVLLKTHDLPCGHPLDVYCFAQEDLLQCSALVEKANPLCGHMTQCLCWNKKPIAPCKEVCGAVLPCGHTCESPCHGDKSAHGICKKPCTHTYINCGHLCRKKCFEDCKICLEVVDKEGKCGHVSEGVLCGKEHLCVQRCGKALPCGHGGKTCRRFCYECEASGVCDPSQCNEVTRVSLPCGHELGVKCSSSANRECKSKCSRSLPCGHPCPGLCWEPCEGKVCLKMSQVQACVLECCHRGLQACGEETSPCREPCNGLSKACGHPCRTSWGDCLGGEVHFPCMEPCERTLLCGHKCPDVCGALCPPCGCQCLLTCSHFKKCSSKCDSPCMPECKNKCEWSCAHGKCVYKCSGKKCKRCDKVLALTLDGGQRFNARCTGLRRSEIKTHPDNPSLDTIYLQLPDCGHWIPEEDFAACLVSKVVGVILCPSCGHPVTSWIHGYKKEMRIKNKEEILGVHDEFFRLKTNLIKRKSILLASIQESCFSKELKEVFSSELPAMNLTKTMATELKVEALSHLVSFVKDLDPQVFSKLKNQLEKTGSLVFIGRDYLRQFNDYLLGKGLPEFLSPEGCFYSFEANSWKVNGGNILQSKDLVVNPP